MWLKQYFEALIDCLSLTLTHIGRYHGRSMSASGVESSSSPKSVSCIKFFDALGFCYSPVHQMQQYYRVGRLDNCFGKWSELFECLNLKRKSSREAQEILAAREKSKTHIWSFRTAEEASDHWEELFGHLNDD